LSPQARLSVSLALSFDSLLPRTPDSLQLRTTGEGDQAIVSTLVAVETEEAVREHAAADEGAKLLLDEARGGCSRRDERTRKPSSCSRTT